GAVDPAVRQEDLAAVLAQQRLVPRLARAVEVRHDVVGVDRHRAEGRERPRHRRLAAGEAAGEPDRQYHPRLRFAAATVFFISMAIVIGPTPPGTGVIHRATSATRAKSTSPTVA